MAPFRKPFSGAVRNAKSIRLQPGRDDLVFSPGLPW
jgi:hypothetical protein